MSDANQIGNYPGGEVPAPGEDDLADEAGAGAPAGGMAVPPQRKSDRPGEGGIEEAGLGGGSGDLGGGGDLSGDVGRLDDEDHSADG